MERRLAAILAADAVGYSRLMGEDEAGTLMALKAHREKLIDPKIAEHYGRIVKRRGAQCSSNSRASPMPSRSGGRWSSWPGPHRGGRDPTGAG